MESLAELRCDCCWRSRLPGIPPTSSPTSTRVRARAPQYCVFSSSLPLYASGETLTSVYADLKGGSVQWWGGGMCIHSDRKGRTPLTPLGCTHPPEQRVLFASSSLENREGSESWEGFLFFTSTVVVDCSLWQMFLECRQCGKFWVILSFE